MNGSPHDRNDSGNCPKDSGDFSVREESPTNSPKSISEVIGNRNSNGDGDSGSDARLDAVWATVEREFEAKRVSLPLSPPMDLSGENITRVITDEDGTNRELSSSAEYVSPLMAHASDATLQISNTTSLLANIHDENEMEDPESAIVTQDHHRIETKQLIPNNKQQSPLQKYRSFLQNHEPSIDMLESFMGNFVFYGLLFKGDHRGISIELYYAGWNLFRWMNDVVLVGWGEGMGTTVGRREEWLSQPLGLGSSNNANGTIKRVSPSSLSLESILNSAVPMLRGIITATTCIYPAMEAWSRRSLHSHPSPRGTPLLFYNDDTQPKNQEEYQMFATTTDLSPQKRRHDWEGRQHRAATASYHLERVRFLARLALLSISRWAQYRRSHRSLEKDGNETKSAGVPPPSLLRRGGELDPYEQLIPLKDAEDEAKVVQYVGKRTGRRSISRTLSSKSTSQLSQSSDSPCISKGRTFVKWLSAMASSKNRIIYLYAVGELLHILRPLYWSHAEKSEWQKRSSSKKLARANSSYSFSIWKAWWVSLLMDMISDKLLQVTNGGDSSSSAKTLQSQRRGSFLARGGGRNTSHQQSPLNSSSSAERAKLEELEYRKNRLPMYLLRSPMYNSVTRPVATFVGKIVSMIPSFGLGQWAAEYILDMMSYWNNNHFMLES